MSYTTRAALYELAWSEPMQSLAKKFGLSDRGLAKITKHFEGLDVPVVDPWHAYPLHLPVNRSPGSRPARGAISSEP
jgi:hypothetical protein